jgi:hypothetical protein
MSMLQSVFRLAVLVAVVGLGQTRAAALSISELFDGVSNAGPTAGLDRDEELLYCPGPPPNAPTDGLGSNGAPFAAPEPSAFVLAGLELFSVLAWRRRRP